MTYEDLIKRIKNEKTGIAKGFDVGFLQHSCCYSNDGEKIFNDLITKTLSMFKSIEASLLKNKEPQEGDFVEYEGGKFARISVDHRNGIFQLSNKIGVRVSSGGYAQASGCTWDSDLDDIEQDRLVFNNLLPTSKSMKGHCWMLIERNDGGGVGSVYFDIDFKVWKLGNSKIDERRKVF